MRLRTFESFWLIKNGILHSYPSLHKDSKTEVLVVGAGITGALISHALMEAGHEVMLVDRRDIAMGSSSATTSLLQYEIDVPLYKLSEMIGENQAAECYQAGVEAIEQLQKLVNNLGIDCGFARKKSLYFSHSKKAARGLKEEYEIRKKHHLDVEWLSGLEIKNTYGIISHGGILSAMAASVDAYKLAHELIHYNVNRGMKVYDQTGIERFETQGPSHRLILTTGQVIEAKKVICCTGFESTQLLKEKIAQLYYTYATVSEQEIVLNKHFEELILWNTSNPYLYMRTTDDGRFLVGGEDSKFNFPLFQQKIKESKSKNLIAKLEKTVPGIQFIEDFSWGGTFGTTKDGLPYIGESPEYEKIFFVLGFGGNGITFSVQGMEMVQAYMKGKTHNLSAYYRFGR
jgi:glycine/D-amino acid oxidase-like deaminating enzyme